MYLSPHRRAAVKVTHRTKHEDIVLDNDSIRNKTRKLKEAFYRLDQDKLAYSLYCLNWPKRDITEEYTDTTW